MFSIMMKHTNRISKKQVGIGLLELTLSLVVISILLIGATRYYQNTQNAQQVNETVNVLQTVLTGAENWKWMYKSYNDISITHLVETGLVPKDFEEEKATPWGSITVESQGEDQVKLTVTNIPEKPCKDLSDIMSRSQVEAVGDCSDGYIGVYPSSKQE